MLHGHETGGPVIERARENHADRVAALADSPSRRGDWRTELQGAKRRLDDQSTLRSIIAAALKRVEQQIADQM